MSHTQYDDQPFLNKAMEDFLAHCNAPGDYKHALHAWLLLGCEYMARECGRSHTLFMLDMMTKHIETAQPSREWPQ